MIDVTVVDEGGATLARFDDPAALGELLAFQPTDAGCCLRFLDPYGDTTFNQLQLPVLVAELNSLAGVVADSLASRAKRLIEFVAEAGDSPHRYVKFVGD